jgi:hypothetical protein
VATSINAAPRTNARLRESGNAELSELLSGNKLGEQQAIGKGLMRHVTSPNVTAAVRENSG